MKNSARGLSRLLPLLVGILFFGSSVWIPGQMGAKPFVAEPPPPKPFSPEGLWYCTGEERFLFVVITATKQEGVFRVEGARLYNDTRSLDGQIRTGTYEYAGNRVEAVFRKPEINLPYTLLTPMPNIPVRGFMAVRGGTPCLILDFDGETPDRYVLIRDPASAPGPQSAAPPTSAELHRELEMPSLTAEPPEVEAGGTVTLKYEFMARDIPDTGLQVEDVATVTGPKLAPVTAETKRSLSHFQHRPEGGGRMDGGGKGSYRITPEEPGLYTCGIEIKAPGYPTSVVRQASFRVKPKPGMSPGTGGPTGAAAPGATAGAAAWVRTRTVMASGDKEGRLPPGLQGPGPGGFSYSETLPDGKTAQNSMSWSEPPATIPDGGTVTLTLTASANPGATVSGWWNFSDYGVWSEWKGDKLVNSYEGGVKRSGSMTFKFKPSSSSEAFIQVSAGHDPQPDLWYTVTWIYRKQGQIAGPAGGNNPPAQEPQGEGGARPPAIANAEIDGPRALAVRMQSPTMVLVPGESSWPNNVGVSGWEPNGGRLLLEIPVVDNWGSLKVYRNLVAAPGPTSKPTSSMTGPEDWFQEAWSARIGARPGAYEVPIIVRQEGGSAGAAKLTIVVLPKGVSGLVPPDAGANSGDALAPSRLEGAMEFAEIELVPGEPSKINGVYVKNWRGNTSDRVEVDIPVSDNWGSLQIDRNLVASPGPASAEPANMTSGRHYFSEMWSARPGAKPGVYPVTIAIRQKGSGEIRLGFRIRVALKSPPKPPFVGGGGSSGRPPQGADPRPQLPKPPPPNRDDAPATDGQDVAAVDAAVQARAGRVSVGELGAELETRDGKIFVATVQPGSAFAAAGIEPGDEVRKLDGGKVEGLPLKEFAAMMSNPPAGGFRIIVARDDEVFMTFLKRPPAPER